MQYKSYKKSDTMCDVICDEPSLLQTMSRFGIPLGQDFSVWDINECYTVDPVDFKSQGKASPFTGNNWGKIQNSNTYTWNYSTYGYQQENHNNAPIKLTTLMNLCNNGETPVMVADGPDTPSTTITWDSMNIFQGWNVLCREDSETAYYATSRRHDGRCNVLLPDYSVTNLTKGAFDENYGSHKSRYFRPFLHATLGWLGCKE